MHDRDVWVWISKKWDYENNKCRNLNIWINKEEIQKYENYPFPFTNINIDHQNDYGQAA